MAAKTVLNYLPRESVVHKLTGTTKLAFFLLFTFASMITYNTYVLLVLLALQQTLELVALQPVLPQVQLVLRQILGLVGFLEPLLLLEILLQPVLEQFLLH